MADIDYAISALPCLMAIFRKTDAYRGKKMFRGYRKLPLFKMTPNHGMFQEQGMIPCPRSYDMEPNQRHRRNISPSMSTVILK